MTLTTQDTLPTLRLEASTTIDDLSCEILELIFQSLCTEDSYVPGGRKALLCCRLTSRYLNAVSSRWAFRHAHISLQSSVDTAEKMLSLLYSNPMIETTISSLYITFYGAYMSQDEKGYLYKNINLPKILPRLTSLRRFGIVGSNSVRHPLLWHRFSLEMSSALRNTLNLRALATVELRGIFRLPSIDWLSMTRNLKKLVVTHVVFDMMNQDPPVANCKHAGISNRENSLKVLEISPSFAYTVHEVHRGVLGDSTVATQNFSSVERLFIVLSGPPKPNWFAERAALHRTFEMFTQNLKYLELGNDGTDGTNCELGWPTCDLYKFSSLETIKIIDSHCQCKAHHYPANFISFLRSEQPVHCVRTIHIVTPICDQYSAELIQSIVSGWSALDDIIQSCYPALTSLVVEFHMPFGSPGLCVPFDEVDYPLEDDIRGLVKRIIPQTMERGSTSTTFIPCSDLSKDKWDL